MLLKPLTTRLWTLLFPWRGGVSGGNDYYHYPNNHSLLALTGDRTSGVKVLPKHDLNASISKCNVLVFIILFSWKKQPFETCWEMSVEIRISTLRTNFEFECVYVSVCVCVCVWARARSTLGAVCLIVSTAKVSPLLGQGPGLHDANHRGGL